MPEVELQAPEIDDIDETADPYKRRVALLVVAITLFGAIVGYLQTVESNREDRAARDAEREAIVGLGRQVGFSSEFQSEFTVFTDAELLARQQAVASSRQRLAPTPEEGEEFAFEASRFAAVRASLTGLTALLGGGEGRQVETAATLQADLQVEADRARLRQAANAELVNDHGGKADAYVAVLTVLAVSLFLIGLSLTVVGRGRRLLLIPGLGLAAWCVLWVGLIANRGVAETPPEAIDAVAEGNRLMARSQFDDAIDAFSEAIEHREDYAVAFGRRADAHFAAGSPQGEVGFVSVTTDEALQAAIDDGERAVDLGSGDDIDAVSSLGFHYFLDGQYDDAARLTNQALDINDNLAFLWLNLGLVELAQGDDDQATEYYDIGMGLIRDEPQAFVRDQLYAAGRVDLELLTELEPERSEVASEFQARLTKSQMELALGAPAERPDGADVEILGFGTDGAFVQADYEATDVPGDTPIAFVWFRRSDPTLPFIEPPAMVEISTLDAELDAGFDGTTFASMGDCLVPAEYRLDVYVGDERVTSDRFTVEETTLGPMVVLNDAPAGVSLCHPADWSRIDSEDPNQVLVGPEDQHSLIILQTFGTPADFGMEGDELLDLVIGAGAQGSTVIRGPEAARVAGGDGRLAVVEGPDGPIALAAVQVSDRAIGAVILGSNDAGEVDAMIAEVLPTVRFQL